MDKITLIAFVVGMIVLLGVGLALAFPFEKGAMTDLSDDEKAELRAQRESVRTAISEGDYETWKSLMEERIAKMQAEITEENFNKVVERNKQMNEFREAMQTARESGDFAKVEELKEKYGIDVRVGMRHFGKGQFMHLPENFTE